MYTYNAHTLMCTAFSTAWTVLERTDTEEKMDRCTEKLAWEALSDGGTYCCRTTLNSVLSTALVEWRAVSGQSYS